MDNDISYCADGDTLDPFDTRLQLGDITRSRYYSIYTMCFVSDTLLLFAVF